MTTVAVWYLRSYDDGDTHRGVYSIATRTTHAVCGAEFVPVKRGDGEPLTSVGYPPNHDQVCPACLRVRVP